MVSVGDKLPFPKCHSFYEELLRLNTHRTISAPVSCVVVAIARNCASTSNVFCRNIDNSGSGEGEPFQLRKLENRSFWKNEEVTNEGLKVGCLLEYRVVKRRCKLDERDEEQFIFHRNAGTELQDVDKILLDLQDDESVHEGLKEALEYYNRKDADRILLDIIHLILVDCERLVEAVKCFNSKDVETIVLDFINVTVVRFECLVEALKCFNPKDVHTIQLDLRNLRFVYFERLVEALKCFNRKDVIIMEVIELIFVKCHDLRKAFKCFNPKSKFPRSQAYSGGTRISFIGIKAGMINNERVTLETMSGEWLDMPLNCRESLVLSTGPVHLQLKRPWDVADDDVGGVAVVKYEAGEATCEGLILRYKPYIISRDEEPVEMQNAFGEVISVGGLRKVLFDTGNEVGTGISRELLLKMNLQPDPKKKKKVELIGEESREFETVQIELVVRGHHYSVCGLVDAVAKDTNLLVGMDIIQQLYDRGYTIGN